MPGRFEPPRPSRRRRLLLAALLAVLGALPRAAAAQLLHLDELPWFCPADSTSRQALLVEADRFEDPRWDWSADRLLVTAILPAGSRSAFFVRMPHVSFDTGDTRVLERWPALAGEAEGIETWPDQRRISSFGQLEAGVLTGLHPPGLGPWTLGAALGLPTGSDRLYPLSSVSMPLRLVLDKGLPLSGTLSGRLRLGWLRNMASGQDYLDASAFPGGTRVGLALVWLRGRNARLLASFDREEREGRRSERVGGEAWLPWTRHGSLGLKAARELAGSGDRAAAWIFGLAWRFDDPEYRPGAAATGATVP